MSSPGKRLAISLFSGGMGLDIGMEQAGIEIPVCVEILPKCGETIRLNRPEIHLFNQDIREVKTTRMMEAANVKLGELFAVVGGPPCQSFSTGGKRSAINDHRGELFMEFIRTVKESNPDFFVFENVSQLMTAAVKHRPIAERPGQNWNLSAYSRNRSGNGLPLSGDENGDTDVRPLEDAELSGSAFGVIIEEFEKLPYELSFAVLNSADFGVPQKRLRLVVVGSKRPGVYRLPQPTHSKGGDNGLPPWRTLRDALKGLKEKTPLHSSYGDEFQRFFAMIPPGKNWRAMPVEEQRKALGNAFSSGGGKTGFFRRLSWDEPTPTIVAKPNRKSCAICHPQEIRPLTVRESARVQGFPDDWTFAGGMHEQYLQIGNAVPVGLGAAVGRSLIEAADREPFGGIRDNWESRKEEMLQAAKAVLKAAARNEVIKGSKTSGRKTKGSKHKNEPTLF